MTTHCHDDIAAGFTRFPMNFGTCAGSAVERDGLLRENTHERSTQALAVLSVHAGVPVHRELEAMELQNVQARVHHPGELIAACGVRCHGS